MYTYTNKLLVIWPPFQSPLVRMVDPSGPHAKSKRLLAPGPSFGFDRSQHLAKSDEDFIRFRSILWWFRNRGGWLHSDILLLAALEEFNRWTQWKRRRWKNRFEEPRTSGVRRAGGAKSHQTNSEQSFSCLHLRRRKWETEEREKCRPLWRAGSSARRMLRACSSARVQGGRSSMECILWGSMVATSALSYPVICGWREPPPPPPKSVVSTGYWHFLRWLIDLRPKLCEFDVMWCDVLAWDRMYACVEVRITWSYHSTLCILCILRCTIFLIAAEEGLKVWAGTE